MLFDDYATINQRTKYWRLIRVQRMLRKINNNSVEYKGPVSFKSDNLKSLDVICYSYVETNGHYKFTTNSVETVSGKDILCHINLIYDEASKIYTLPDIEKERIIFKIIII